MAISDCAYCLYQFRANLKEAKPPIECRSTGKPCLGCNRQQDLHIQIEATKKLLDKLIIEEHNLRTRLNRCHDPIQRLPLEITSYIFSLTLSDFVTQKSVTQKSLPRYARHLWKTNERTPLTLGAVCQKWRAIAWSTCHLWSDLMLALHNAPTDVQIDVVRDWLQRSQSLPLKIRLFFEDIDEDSVDLLPFKKFAGIFNGHSVRWETLSVYSPTWISDLFVGSEYGAPLLKTLELAEKETKIPVGDFALAGPEPQPTSVNFAGYHRLTAIAISWNNVTHARFDTWRFSLDNYLELFRRGINLVRLHFHVVDGRGRPTGGTFGLPIQHQLQDLLVSIGRDFTFDSERPFYPPLFDTITLPSLKHLTIDGPATESLGSVKQFLARSSPPLKSLNLTAKCDQQHALDLLYDLPSSLKNIKLDLQDTTADFRTLCDHLSRAPSVSYGMSPPLHRDLLPSLEEFEYCWTKLISDRIPFDRLPNILRPLSGQQRPLKKLALHPRGDGHQDDPLLSTDNIQESAIRGLIGLLDDGVGLYLPDKVSREDLLAMLEKY